MSVFYETAALVELTPGTGTLRFAGAGHVSNVILRPDGQPYGDRLYTCVEGDLLVSSRISSPERWMSGAKSSARRA
jgi:hypothetical protein